jgi:hypothetical protein
VRAPPSRRSAGLVARVASPPAGAAAAMQLSARRSQSSGSRGRACATSCAQCEPWVGHWVGQGFEVHATPFACLPGLARAAGRVGGPLPAPDQASHKPGFGGARHFLPLPAMASASLTPPACPPPYTFLIRPWAHTLCPPWQCNTNTWHKGPASPSCTSCYVLFVLGPVMCSLPRSRARA